MLANMKTEVDRLQGNEDRLGAHVEELEKEMDKTSQKISQLELEVKHIVYTYEFGGVFLLRNLTGYFSSYYHLGWRQDRYDVNQG